MKNFYDVARSSSLKGQTPRIVQIHLKCKKALVDDESSGFNNVSFSTSWMAESRTIKEESETSAISDLSKHENCITVEQSLDTTNSDKSFDEDSLRRSSISVSKSLTDEKETELNTRRNSTYWLSFPTAMRNVLRYPGSNSKIEKSTTDIQYSNSTEDLSLPNNRNSGSVGIFRNSSLRRSFKSRSLKLTSENLSKEEIWPRGKFSPVDEKQCDSVFRNSYEIKWKDENIASCSIFVRNIEPTEKKEDLGPGNWRSDKLAHKQNYDTPEVRHIYGYSSNDSSKTKLSNKLVSTCCV